MPQNLACLSLGRLNERMQIPSKIDPLVKVSFEWIDEKVKSSADSYAASAARELTRVSEDYQENALIYLLLLLRNRS